MEQTKQAICCIFDLDGVLVDTAVYHYKAWKQLANELGFDFSEAQNEQLKGVSRMDSLNKILQWGKVEKTAAEKQVLATRKNDWYIAMVNKMTANEVLPGSLALLTALKAANIKLALGSASRNSPLILERTALARFFDAIVDGNSVTSSKPDPEVFIKAAALLGAKKKNCIVFEDANAGVQAGKAAGMKVVGIGTAENLPGADVVIKDLSAITIDQLEAL